MVEVTEWGSDLTREERDSIVKAAISGEIGASQAATIEGKKTATAWKEAKTLEPPYDPRVLVHLFEHASSLRPNVDSYAVNIDGYGHRFEEVIDLNREEAFEEIRLAMLFDRLAEADDGTEDGDPGDSEMPTDAEVKAHIEQLEHDSKIELMKLRAFFEFATDDYSFIHLRKLTRIDLEVQGNAYWEVIRNGEGFPAQFLHVPAFSMRLLASGEPIQIDTAKKRTPFTYETIKVWKRFRLFVQKSEGGNLIYFKEFGDPRIISNRTGKVYPTAEAMERSDEEKGASPATEIIHFRIPSLRSAYGIPRWTGSLLSVLGSRKSEEINALYFDNKTIPPMAIMVSGGNLNADSHNRIKDLFETQLKGTKNFHKVVIIEATPASGSSALDHQNSPNVRIEMKPLTDAQQSDALFQNYDERNIDKIGSSFRLPRILRGDARDFNRATADASLSYAETQVFAPERTDFDWFVNRKILPALGIRFWRFVSHGPQTRDPVDLADVTVKLVAAGVLLPGEARELVSAFYERDFQKLDEFWEKIPLEVLKLGHYPKDYQGPKPGEEKPEPSTEPEPEEDDGETEDATQGEETEEDTQEDEEGVKKAVRYLLGLREELFEEELEEARRAFEKSHDEENGPDVVTIKLPADEFAALFDVE